MTNLASGSKDQVKVLIDNGVIVGLIILLKSPHIEIVEQSILGLGNLAADSYKARDLVL